MYIERIIFYQNQYAKIWTKNKIKINLGNYALDA